MRTFGRLFTEEDFNNLIVKHAAPTTEGGAGTDVLLRDIGEAVLGPETEETVLKESGIPMIALAVTPQPGSNYVAIADEFYSRYNLIKKDIPADFKVDIALDNTAFIKKSISEVEETLFISFGLVIIIIYLFFRDWLIAFRPLIDIPVSLIGAFFIMYLMGFTINILTLLAIVLATGLVVDDGIVVTEAIFKKIEAGMEQAPRGKGRLARKFTSPLSATSITLAVVFLPIVFLQGFTGRLFREFGIVVAGAVLISAFVSLTLTPVLNVYAYAEGAQAFQVLREVGAFLYWHGARLQAHRHLDDAAPLGGLYRHGGLARAHLPHLPRHEERARAAGRP